MRIVLDTNVLISAFVFPGGAPEEVYRLVIKGQAELVTSRALLAEFGRILTSKFGWQRDRVEEAVAQVVRIAEVVKPAEKLQVITADPSDNRVLEAALQGRVETVASGDRHLLQLKSWKGISFRSPSAFLTALG